MVSISWVEGRTGGAARMPGVATSREVRAREPQPRTLQRGLAPPPAAVDGGVETDSAGAARAEVAPATWRRLAAGFLCERHSFGFGASHLRGVVTVVLNNVVPGAFTFFSSWSSQSI